jgi:hypothetical protein
MIPNIPGFSAELHFTSSQGEYIAPRTTPPKILCQGSSRISITSERKNALLIWFIPPSLPTSEIFRDKSIVRQ